MIKDSFTYIAVLIFAAAVLVYLPRLIKGNAARKFFSFAPPVVLIYLGLMARGISRRPPQRIPA